MFDKLSDFVSGAFIVFYVAFSHFYEAHALCVLAIVAGLNLIVRSVTGTSPVKTLLGKIGFKVSKQA